MAFNYILLFSEIVYSGAENSHFNSRRGFINHKKVNKLELHLILNLLQVKPALKTER